MNISIPIKLMKELVKFGEQINVEFVSIGEDFERDKTIYYINFSKEINPSDLPKILNTIKQACSSDWEIRILTYDVLRQKFYLRIKIVMEGEINE